MNSNSLSPPLVTPRTRAAATHSSVTARPDEVMKSQPVIDLSVSKPGNHRTVETTKSLVFCLPVGTHALLILTHFHPKSWIIECRPSLTLETLTLTSQNLMMFPSVEKLAYCFVTANVFSTVVRLFCSLKSSKWWVLISVPQCFKL